MSRIGRMPITIPAGVEVKVADGNFVTVKGPKGELKQQLCPLMGIENKDGVLRVTRPNDEKETRALHGLTRTLLSNMVVGVNETFKKELDVNGVGYRVAVENNKLILTIGYSHNVEMAAPAGITVEAPNPNKIIISGCDKQAARSVLPSLIRARASSMWTRPSAARSVRPALRSKEVCRYD